MQRFIKATFLTLAALVATAMAVGVGERCDGTGLYACTDDFNRIVICHLGTWQLSANCASDCCAYNTAIMTPYCYC
ncbi:hypothetical protein BDV12DRAFT_181648 [Aspergillus spectabilis]